MPKNKEQYEEIRMKSKKVIIDTALHLFVTKGYHATSIQAIAKEAGIAIGLMYHYFNSKEDMLVYIMEDKMQEIRNSAMTELSKTTNANDIHNIVDALFATIIKKSDSWRLIITVSFQPDVAKKAKEMIDALSLHQQDIYVAHFKRAGIENPEECARTLFILIHSALISYALTENSEELEIVRKNIIERLIDQGI